MKLLSASIFLFWAMLCPPVMIAQTSHHPGPEPEGPSKFDRNFNGIGPEVYLLPPPKTQEELTTEQYILKKENQHQLDSVFNQIYYKSKLRLLHLPGYLTDSAAILAGNHADPAATHARAQLQNNLGVQALVNGQLDVADSLLQLSIRNMDSQFNLEDYLDVKNNIAVLVARKGDLEAAHSYYSELLSIYTAEKNQPRRIEAVLDLAVIQARLGRFDQAHQTVIKTAMPGLQRTKNYQKIVEALNLLASFKEMQEKSTEAKWIYLQAIDVARIHQDEKGLAESLYHLARLKFQIEDVELAIEDYLQAKQFASKLNMESLLVEIHDGLGDAYLKLNNYQAANLALDEYLNLKSDLLIKNPPFHRNRGVSF